MLLPIQNHCTLLVVAEADGALDKARKHKKRQLQDTLNLVLKKRKVISYYVFFCWTTLLCYPILLCRLSCSCVLCTIISVLECNKEDKTVRTDLWILKPISKVFSLSETMMLFNALTTLERISHL